MPELHYGELTIKLWEMDRMTALQCERAYNEFLQSEPDGEQQVNDEIDYLLTRFTPCRLTYQGKVLDDGSHTVTLDDKTYALSSPLTRADFDRLPYTLTFRWSMEAGKVNPVVVTNFLTRRPQRVTPPMTAVPLSAAGHTNAPNEATPPPTIPTTGT